MDMSGMELSSEELGDENEAEKGECEAEMENGETRGKIEEKKANNLKLDSKGHCLFCLAKLKPVEEGKTEPGSEWEEREKAFPVTSLEYLAHFLKLEKVNDFGTDEMKGSLCEECLAINEKFTEACIQLEKVKLKVAGCLKLVRWKLSDVDVAGQAEYNLKKHQGSEAKIDDDCRGLVEGIRKEVVEKCSVELTTLRPTLMMIGDPSLEETEAMDYQPDFISPTAPPTTNGNGVNHDESQSPGGQCNCSTCLTASPSRSGSRKKRKTTNTHQKTYKCPECEEEFSTPSEREEHQRSHFLPVDQSLTCDRCYNLFRREAAFTKHRSKCVKITKHTRSCRYCKCGFDTMDRFKQHLMRVHIGIISKDWKYECDLCGKRYKDRWTLVKHHKNDHKILEVAASTVQTGKVLLEMEEPLQVFRGDAPEAIMVKRRKCRTCFSLFRKQSRYEEHYRSEHLPTWLKCRRCGEEFAELKFYRFHYNRVHVLGLKVKKKKCPICKVSFPTKGLLNRHRRKDACTPKPKAKDPNNGNGSKPKGLVAPCSCWSCREEFDSFSKFRKHWKEAHWNTGQPQPTQRQENE